MGDKDHLIPSVADCLEIFQPHFHLETKESGTVCPARDVVPTDG